MRRPCFPSMAVAVPLLAAAPAAAQDAMSVSLIGQRVRAESCGRGRNSAGAEAACRRATGELIGVTPDSLSIRVGADSVAVLARDGLERFERSAGIRRRTGQGALIGGAIGLGLGLLFSAAVASEGCGDDPGCAWVALGAPLVTTAAGLGIGAGIGFLSRREGWIPVAPAALSLRPLFPPGGAGIAAQLRF